MIKKIITICGLVLALTAAMALSAGATMITGAISFDGTTTFDNYNLNKATEFKSFSNVAVSAGEGDYSSATPGTSVTFTPFGFRASNVTPTPFDLWTFTDSGGKTFRFEATSIVVSYSSPGNIVLDGSGIAKITGYEDTPGTWSISANRAGGTASFSSSAEVVPEPTTIFLFGLGIVGIAVFGRKRFRRT